jgi:hypothetical protein
MSGIYLFPKTRGGIRMIRIAIPAAIALPVLVVFCISDSHSYYRERFDSSVIGELIDSDSVERFPAMNSNRECTEEEFYLTHPVSSSRRIHFPVNAKKKTRTKKETPSESSHPAGSKKGGPYLLHGSRTSD